MATQEETQTLEQTLKKTDFGQWVNDNKKAILLGGFVLVIAIIGYSIASQVKESKRTELLNKVYTVNTTIFKPYIDGKVKSDKFNESLASIQNEYIANTNLISPFLQSLNKLDKDGKLNASHLETAMAWMNKMNKSSDMYLFFAVRVSSLFENLGMVDKSLEIHNNLSSRKSELLKSQIYFNLGRLNLLKNNKEEAKNNFDKVISDFSDSEFSNLSKIYLGKM